MQTPSGWDPVKQPIANEMVFRQRRTVVNKTRRPTKQITRILSVKWRELIKKVWEADLLLCPKYSRES